MSIFSFLSGLIGLGGGGDSQGISVSKHSANEGLPIIYGEIRVPAIKVFKTASRYHCPIAVTNYDTIYNPMPGSGSEETKKAKEWLHRIDVFAQGPITAISRYYVDGEAHTVSRLATQKPYFRAVGYYGKTTQTAFTDLSPASNRWTPAHKGVGVAYAATRFFAHSSKPQYNGEPELHAIIKGRAIYDPRLDSTQVGGAGTQRADDDTTWTYTNNWALGLLDYLRHSSGRNLPDTEIDFPSFMVGADKCDISVTIPTPLTNTTGGTVLNYWDRLGGLFSNINIGAFYPSYREWQGIAETTQKRHMLNISLDPKDKVKTNVLKLLNGIKADLPFSQGKYKLTMEDVEASNVYDFDHDTIIGGLKITYGGRSTRLNRVTVEYLNRNKDYKQDTVSWPDTDSITYTDFLAEDQAEVLHQTVQGDGITEFYQADDLAEFLVRSSRVGITISTKLAPVGSLLEPNDVIGVTHDTPGWVNKRFRVQSVKVNEDFTADIVATEYDPSVYTWSPKSNEPLNTSDDLPNPWDEPAAVDNLAATPAHATKADGTVISGFNVTWDAPTDTGQLDYIEIAWKLDAATDYDNVSRVPVDNAGASITGLIDGQDYDIRVTYRTTLGQISVIAEVTKTLTAAAGTKLGGVAAGATVGAPNGTNVGNIPAQQFAQELYDPGMARGLEGITDAPNGQFRLAHNGVGVTAISNAGLEGGDVIRCVGPSTFFSRKVYPVDVNKKYRVKFRVKQITDPSSGGTRIYAGVACLDADYINSSEGYGTYRYCAIASLSLTVADGWRYFEGTITGIISSRNSFKSYTKYVRPMCIVNYLGDGTADVDFLSFEEVTDYDAIGGTKPPEDADVTNYTDDRIKNGAIQLNADGTLSYWNGSSWVNLGATTIGGLGYGGDLNATNNTGALADRDTVDTVTILDGAANIAGVNSVSNYGYITTSWSSVVSKSITITDASASSFVTILGKVYVGNVGSSAAQYVNIRILKGGVGISPVYTEVVKGDAVEIFSSIIPVLDLDQPGNGTFIYHIQMQCSPSSTAIWLAEATIAVLAAKR